MPLTLLDQISAKSPELTKSERKIALAVLDDPALTATENIAQLARRAGVSEPTVYRFCRTFGTDGFPAFKLALTSELSREGSGPRESVKPGDSVDDVTRKVISGASSALKELSRSLEPAILARCIDLISQSRRIVIAAEGLSQPAGVWLQVRLIRLGIPCELSTDAALGTLRAASLRPGDFILEAPPAKAAADDSEAAASLNLEQVERQTIAKALKRSEGNLTRAAEYLGITRYALYRKMEKLGL